MDILLPDAQDGLNGLMTSLAPAALSGWVGQLHETDVELSMPRFKYEFKKKLKDILTTMGMGVAFSRVADFTNISSDYPLAIDEVTHQAFIETNEEGTEAAAATVVSIVLTSMPQTLVINLDHPFIYLIRETTTNSVIFMGRVSDPLAN